MGSQYDLEQEGDFLDEYEEYIKVEDYSDDDGDIVYIRAGRVGSIDLKPKMTLVISVILVKHQVVLICP